MLWVAVLSITVTLPMIYYYRQQMIRDREEELVHRGVEYERAVRKYYRKFGAYPPSLEMLESGNHMRFLRKRYKDPINGQDFKTLSYADVMTSFAAAIPGGTIPGGQSLGTPVSDTTPAPQAPLRVQPRPLPRPTPAPQAPLRVQPRHPVTVRVCPLAPNQRPITTGGPTVVLASWAWPV